MSPAGDSLAGLRDIRLPAPVSWWPPAPGWWVVAALAATVLAASIWWLWRLWRRGTTRRRALAELDRLAGVYQAQGAAAGLAADLSVLVRRLALVRFPREQVAGLTGEAWLAFLDRTGGGDRFSRGPGRVLAIAPYSRATDLEAGPLLALVRDWIRHGRPRKREVRR